MLLESQASVSSARLKRKSRGSGAGAVHAQSLSAVAYKHLHDELVSGRIPTGTVLSEAAIAKALGVSRTPVGEAIRQLVREGLLEQVPRYGTVVRKLDRAELIEHYELREALESYAAGQAARRATPAEAARIIELCEAMQRIADALQAGGAGGAGAADEQSMLRKILAADMAFHFTVVQAAANRRIAEMIHTARSIARIFSIRRQPHDERLVRSVYEKHRMIADAIARGDAAAASALMLEHIQLSKQQALESFDLDATRGRSGIGDLPADIQKELNEIEDNLAMG